VGVGVGPPMTQAPSSAAVARPRLARRSIG
jgi:hypothetical protein